MNAPFTITIDGRPVEVSNGESVLAAARKLGIGIPTLCYLEKCGPLNTCQLCLVKLNGKLVPSCGTKATPGMVIESETEEVLEARRTALELLFSDHVGDCVGPCKTACPARLDIPGFVAQVSAGDHRRAAEIVTDDLTLPSSLGRVCPRLCETRCQRCQLEESVSIRNLHRFSADHQRASGSPHVPGKEAPTGKRVGIVGTGPAGLAAADRLLRRGHGVVLFDAHPQPGGMLRYGIPEFRLPRAVLDAEIGMIRELGAEIRLSQKLGRDFTLEELRRNFDAVFLAVGAQGSRCLGCPGEELATPALEFLEKITDGQPPIIGSEVLVVGGGNTAMDASRTALRLGASSVRVLYRRTRREMPCLMEEVEAAEQEGVRVEFLVAPVRLEKRGDKLCLTGVRMELGAPDESGRARPVPIAGSEFEVEATCVIAAIGQSVDFGTKQAPNLATSKWGIAVDPATLATNLPGVFAGGDAVTGPDLAVRAVAAGKLAAASIDQHLRGEQVTGSPEAITVLMGKLSEQEQAVLFREIEQSPRTAMPHLPLEKRRFTFEEVELGFSQAEAMREARRCLRCGCAKADTCLLRQFATNCGANPLRFVGERRAFQRDLMRPGVIFEQGKCILCGICVKLTEMAAEPLGLTFVGRGFEVRVAAPFNRTIEEGLQKVAAECVKHCPTGALVLADKKAASTSGT